MKKRTKKFMKKLQYRIEDLESQHMVFIRKIGELDSKVSSLSQNED